MEALFIIPAMVSPNVNDRVVPSIAKLLERNVAITNFALFRAAVFKKYLSDRSNIFQESGNPLEVFLMESGLDLRKGKMTPISESVYGGISGGEAVDRANLKRRKEKADEYKQTMRQRTMDRKMGEKLDKQKRAQEKELSLAKTAAGNRDRANEIRDAWAHANDESGESKHIDIDLKNKGGATSKEKAQDPKPMKIDEIERPAGITFFHNISLEPTIIEIPISQPKRSASEVEAKAGRTPERLQKINYYDSSENERVVRIGIKCIPYRVDNISDVISLMSKWKNSWIIGRWFRKSINNIVKKIARTVPIVLPNVKRRQGKPAGMFSRGYPGGGIVDDNKKMIKYAPSKSELTKSDNLTKYISVENPSTWSTAVILSSYDLQEQNMYNLSRDYRKLVDVAWGDMIITNETKESIFFCTQRMMTCLEMSFTQLKNIINLDNVLDYAEISGKTTPFSAFGGRTTALKNAIAESVDLNSKINKILKEGK
jgi:hypothetical protein